ncbi:MAG: hypothetical protein KJT03_07900, partial [Verrucomicrobiae bacterium]|nr:hypothetical protein [Verrucomicrobiae bacterium]
MKIFFRVLPLLSLVLFCSCKQAKNPADLLVGVWQVTRELDLTDHTETDPENAHFVFTRHHIMNAGGKEDRPVIEKNF